MRIPNTAWWLVVLATPALAQVDRYELGARLARFERAWEGAPAQGDDARARALPQVEAAVRSFFSMQTAKAVEALDLAWLELAGAPTPATRFQASLTARPERRLLAPGEPLQVALRQVYGADRPAAPLTVTLTLRDAAGERQVVTQALGALPAVVELPTAGLAEGALTLEVGFQLGDLPPLAPWQLQLGLAADVDARLAALAGARPADDVARLSFTAWRETLAALRERSDRLETELPAARLLAEAERLAADPRATLAGRPGEHWLRLPVGRGVGAVRVWAPAGAGPFPLVLALHGAGGSENMFFDTYGAGKVVELCRARGWLLVAPRLGFTGGVPLPGLIDAVAALYPVDRTRVFAVGHSMGAGAALLGVNMEPSRFTAVAILGGGGMVQAPGLTEVPFFVGAGERDFGGPRARATAAALRELGARVDERTYPQAEHLLVVQEALPDVFRFFEQATPAAPTAPTTPSPAGKRFF